MKRQLIILLLFSLGSILCAYEVRLQSWDIPTDVKTLNQNNVSVDYVNHATGTIIAYLRGSSEEALLRNLGFDPQPMKTERYAPELESRNDASNPDNAYLSISEYTTFMSNIAAQYPNICQLVQIGSSGQNRPLLYLKISDNVGLDEVEPEFRYISSIHGDEVVGYDLMIRLIQLLTSSYGTDTRITNLVDNTEIWINPMANPDGYVLQQRYNSAGIDLNRNFPMPTGEEHPDGESWGVENVAFMNWARGRNFVQSINYHGGALVMNYPWDYTYSLAPDDALLRSMALTYSTPYTAMYNGEFDQGITNGAAWYVITGSFQDWNYGYTDCIDITCEVSSIKWPAASTLDSYWNQNRESILSYMEYAQKGLHGTVTSSSGLALEATISVAGNARAVHTDPALGDYHRLLLGGTYSVTASAPGYISQTLPASIPANGGATLNFTLEPAQLVSFMGTIRDIEGYPVPQAVITINTTPVTTFTTSAEGQFFVPSIYEGDYVLQISSGGSPTQNRNIVISASNPEQTIILSQPLFLDDFEDGITNWTATSPWAISTDGSNHVLKDSPSGNYANNINKSIKLTNPVSLSGVQEPSLSFRAKYSLESGYDFVHIEASSNGTSWSNLASLSGSQTSWQDFSYSLAAFTGSNCYIRFRIQTDQNTTGDGISIDDVQIMGRASSQIIHGDITLDGIVNKTDLNLLLGHILNPDLPGWNPQLTEAADVDNNDILNSLDAYMLHRYITDSSYRFVVQTGEAQSFPQLEIDYSYDAETSRLNLSFSAPQELRALDFVLGEPNSTMLTDVSAPEGILDMELLYRNAYICISDGQDMEIGITFSSSLSSIPLVGSLNGHPFQYSIVLSSSGSDQGVSPLVNSLAQNYPNPFNPSTTISYSLAKSGSQVNLQIFNSRGQLVRNLVDTPQAEGLHRVVWDGKDDQGGDLAAGLYFYRLRTEDYSQINRMLLLK